MSLNDIVLLKCTTVLLFVFYLVNVGITSVTGWSLISNNAYYTLVHMPSTFVPNGAITIDTAENVSLIACSQFCNKEIPGSFYYSQQDEICDCNSIKDINVNVSAATNGTDRGDVVYGYIDTTVEISTNTSHRLLDVQPPQESCSAIYHLGYQENAIYVITPADRITYHTFCDMEQQAVFVAEDCLHWFQMGYTEDAEYNIRLSNGTAINVWCDMSGCGWTVIQRRFDGSLDFNRSWTEYVNGFGSVSGEHWLGLEAMYLLTQSTTSLLIEMETFGDISPLNGTAEYAGFSLTSASDEYRLSFVSYTGGVGDSLIGQADMQFTTYDNDNDIVQSENCATLLGYGFNGWWYKGCYNCNLNSDYRGIDEQGITGIHWEKPWGLSYSLKACSMKIRSG